MTDAIFRTPGDQIGNASRFSTVLCRKMLSTITLLGHLLPSYLIVSTTAGSFLRYTFRRVVMLFRAVYIHPLS
jgi:hypothetical protein